VATGNSELELDGLVGLVGFNEGDMEGLTMGLRVPLGKRFGVSMGAGDSGLKLGSPVGFNKVVELRRGLGWEVGFGTMQEEAQKGPP